ncbi:hypothetical protein PM082_021916 [Marasmius tenuissimus]|nr:hypothetical protein PM082_021916 [Marasmius tenuissimus]
MSSDEIEAVVEPFLSVQSVIIKPIATLSSIFLVYGIYIIAFGLCTNILYHRKAPSFGLYMTCTICLFILATTCIAIETFVVVSQALLVFHASKTRDFGPLLKYLQHDDGEIAAGSVYTIASTTVNAVADIMLIHRCYIVWGSNKILLYTLSSVAFVLNGIQF